MGFIQGTVRPPERSADILLEASGSDAALRDAHVCQRIVARNARTFSVASRLLPREKRRGVFAIYAACRTADDIVDVNGADQPDLALQRFKESAFQSLEQRSESPILRELARAWHRFAVPDETLYELFRALNLDLHHRGYETWPELEAYCQGVAGSVGAMCCAVFGVADDISARRSQAVTCARTLGVAMQLTNILRDVGEDARRGRCYLPNRELTQFGLTRSEVLSGSVRNHRNEWRALMRFQVDRARALYRQALPGITLLQRDAQRCAIACATGYSRILDAIERADFDTFSQRVATSRLTLLGVAWRSWRNELPADLAKETGEG
ncbi:MAG TPA: phytoene/squalene synthase family protein [Gemmatimonadaceae bacterium]|nr:phytoene/squalene synthase family protein [Gemmatimonadaceae bacterium]